MSKIITPMDRIQITIDNQTGQVSMVTSRELPTYYICYILAHLIAKIEKQVMVGVIKPVSDPNPFAELSGKAENNGEIPKTE